MSFVFNLLDVRFKPKKKPVDNLGHEILVLKIGRTLAPVLLQTCALDLITECDSLGLIGATQQSRAGSTHTFTFN